MKPSMTGLTANTSDSNAGEKNIYAISEKRLERFAGLFPRVFIRGDAEAIHDARVWSRRLQQILRVLFPKPVSKKTRKLTRRLRRVRRALGDCRNLDVVVELVREKIAMASNPVVRDAWDRLKVHLQEKRIRELNRAREDLAGYDIVDFVNRAQALLCSVESSKEAQKTLGESINQAFADWEEAVDNARENQEPNQLHALRIAGKRLRYRIELLAECGESSAKSRIQALKTLQDQLGQWHDRQILLQFVGKFLGQTDFLADHPDLSRTLLVEMERERRRNNAMVSNILKSTEKIRLTWNGGASKTQEITP